MDYLALCNEVKKECHQVADVEMTSVENQRGVLARITKWVNVAYREILNRHEDWKFLYVRDVSFNLSKGKREYSTTYLSLADVRLWDLRYPNIYETEKGKSDESRLVYIPYDEWVDGYSMGEQVEARPQLVMVYPDNNALGFHSIPDAEYTVTLGYWKDPPDLVDINDEPVIPARYHDIIVQLALMKYAKWDDAPEIYLTANIEYKRLIGELEDKFLPDPVLSWSPVA